MPALALLRAALRRTRPDPDPSTPPPPTRLTTTRTPDPAHLAAYQRVCGFGAAFDDVLPLTYPHVLAFPLTMRLMTARDFPLPLLGLVHTSIEVDQYRPIRPTEELRLTVRTTALARHRRGTEATLLTEATSPDGALLWQSRSTYLARHKTAQNASTSAPGTAPAPAPAPAPGEKTWELHAGLGRRYAAVSGDRNPIHLHALTARPFGFPRAIAHGMWTAARCLAEQGQGQGQGQQGIHTRIEFRAPVPLPTAVAYSAPTPHTFELRSPEGKLHLTGVTGPTDAPP
ncbi:MaoC/PaaZ C-terminal domain-containing protein [Streptomyces sp. Je 1-369]|uniref:MaoC family dehydratase n=1 Tax=Streptomyces sp. Je 1-369 TaxID=2966192 RepID=UPI0022862438|nr:MaoC/PaaZ C-terminal domain-containing protein [Streptomyces sp. Je 1-369]WAL97141.1 MaoC/PaaZ C-terminal domain-containing protein [Streptomyces sp. Je 1-369]